MSAPLQNSGLLRRPAPRDSQAFSLSLLRSSYVLKQNRGEDRVFLRGDGANPPENISPFRRSSIETDISRRRRKRQAPSLKRRRQRRSETKPRLARSVPEKHGMRSGRSGIKREKFFKERAKARRRTRRLPKQAPRPADIRRMGAAQRRKLNYLFKIYADIRERKASLCSSLHSRKKSSGFSLSAVFPSSFLTASAMAWL